MFKNHCVFYNRLPRYRCKPNKYWNVIITTLFKILLLTLLIIFKKIDVASRSFSVKSPYFSSPQLLIRLCIFYRYRYHPWRPIPPIISRPSCRLATFHCAQLPAHAFSKTYAKLTRHSATITRQAHCTSMQKCCKKYNIFFIDTSILRLYYRGSFWIKLLSRGQKQTSIPKYNSTLHTEDPVFLAVTGSSLFYRKIHQKTAPLGVFWY